MRDQGLLPISANFEPATAEPFDARTKVSLKSDLIKTSTFGAFIAAGFSPIHVWDDPVELNNGLYILKAEPYTLIANWEKVGSGVGNHSGLILDDGTNPHGTTKSDVNLGNADNTSDANKPISTATANALGGKVDNPVITILDTSSPLLSIDMDAQSFLNLNIQLGITSMSIINGTELAPVTVYVSKNYDNLYLDIANNYNPTSGIYSVGDVVGVQIDGVPLGIVYYKAHTAVTLAEPFDPSKWNLYIKLVDDVAILLSYAGDAIDSIEITPRKVDPLEVSATPLLYYVINPTYNAGQK
tara:strand:+ start:12667 stop:13563 length:897 start_codon:yes stop_codon:yes gene_type:complete